MQERIEKYESDQANNVELNADQISAMSKKEELVVLHMELSKLFKTVQTVQIEEGKAAKKKAKEVERLEKKKKQELDALTKSAEVNEKALTEIIRLFKAMHAANADTTLIEKADKTKLEKFMIMVAESEMKPEEGQQCSATDLVRIMSNGAEEEIKCLGITYADVKSIVALAMDKITVVPEVAETPAEAEPTAEVVAETAEAVATEPEQKEEQTEAVSTQHDVEEATAPASTEAVTEIIAAAAPDEDETKMTEKKAGRPKRSGRNNRRKFAKKDENEEGNAESSTATPAATSAPRRPNNRRRNHRSQDKAANTENQDEKPAEKTGGVPAVAAEPLTGEQPAESDVTGTAKPNTTGRRPFNRRPRRPREGNSENKTGEEGGKPRSANFGQQRSRQPQVAAPAQVAA